MDVKDARSVRRKKSIVAASDDNECIGLTYVIYDGNKLKDVNMHREPEPCE